MTTISIDKEWATLHLPVEESLHRVAKLLSEFVTKTEFHESKASYWQLIFLQSEANGCIYRGEDLPYSKWQWPKDTWFQEQLRHRLEAIVAARRARN